MTELTEIFVTEDMNRLKKELARLVASKDYKAINVLLRRNTNTWKFDIRSLNEEISCDDRHFLKRKGVMKFESKTTSNNRTRKSKQVSPQNDAYEAHLYNPNDGYVSRI